jgi:hypothetical protein
MNYYAQPYSPCPQTPGRDYYQRPLMRLSSEAYSGQYLEYYEPNPHWFEPFPSKTVEAAYQGYQGYQEPPSYDYQVRREMSVDTGSLFGLPFWLLIIPFGFFWVHHTGKR